VYEGVDVRTLESYVTLMTELLDLRPLENPTDDIDLYEEWGLDSLQAFELIILTEQLAGLDVPVVEVPAMFTIGDAYIYYGKCVQMAINETE
jgi:acyl carrier protein